MSMKKIIFCLFLFTASISSTVGNCRCLDYSYDNEYPSSTGRDLCRYGGLAVVSIAAAGALLFTAIITGQEAHYQENMLTSHDVQKDSWNDGGRGCHLNILSSSANDCEWKGGMAVGCDRNGNNGDPFCLEHNKLRSAGIAESFFSSLGSGVFLVPACYGIKKFKETWNKSSQRPLERATWNSNIDYLRNISAETSVTEGVSINSELVKLYEEVGAKKGLNILDVYYRVRMGVDEDKLCPVNNNHHEPMDRAAVVNWLNNQDTIGDDFFDSYIKDEIKSNTDKYFKHKIQFEYLKPYANAIQKAVVKYNSFANTNNANAEKKLENIREELANAKLEVKNLTEELEIDENQLKVNVGSIIIYLPEMLEENKHAGSSTISTSSVSSTSSDSSTSKQLSEVRLQLQSENLEILKTRLENAQAKVAALEDSLADIEAVNESYLSAKNEKISAYANFNAAISNPNAEKIEIKKLEFKIRVNKQKLEDEKKGIYNAKN